MQVLRLNGLLCSVSVLPSGWCPALYSSPSSHTHLPPSVSAYPSLHSGVVCGEVLPAVVGLVWALRSTPQDRTDKLRTIFSLSYEDAGQLQLSFKEFIRLRGHRLVNIPQEGEKKERKDDFLSPFAQRVNFDEKCVMTLYHTVGARMEVVCYRVSLCVILDCARCHRRPGSWMDSCYRTWRRKWTSITRCGWVGGAPLPHMHVLLFVLHRHKCACTSGCSG